MLIYEILRSEFVGEGHPLREDDEAAPLHAFEQRFEAPRPGKVQTAAGRLDCTAID